MKLLAQVCQSSQQEVVSFLQRLRQTAFQVAAQRKKAVCLNLLVGQLWIKANLAVEFKNCSPAFNHQFTALLKKLTVEDPKKSEVFSPRSKISSLLKDQPEKRDYSHLSHFLQNQINRGTGSLTKSQMGQTPKLPRSTKFNNALIELASREVKKRRLST